MGPLCGGNSLNRGSLRGPIGPGTWLGRVAYHHHTARRKLPREVADPALNAQVDAAYQAKDGISPASTAYLLVGAPHLIWAGGGSVILISSAAVAVAPNGNTGDHAVARAITAMRSSAGGASASMAQTARSR
jgi:hypothetical protein